MRASPYTQRKGTPAVRHGLLFGAIIVVVYILSAFIQQITGTTRLLMANNPKFMPLSLLNQASLLVAVVLFFVAGVRTASATFGIAPLIRAGLIAGFAAGPVEVVTVIIDATLLCPHIGPGFGGDFRTSRRNSTVLGSLFTMIVYLCLGGGLALFWRYCARANPPRGIVALINWPVHLQSPLGDREWPGLLVPKWLFY